MKSISKNRKSIHVIMLWLASLTLHLVGCGSSETLRVTDVWGRPSPMSASNAAFYMHIQNSGQEAEELVAAEIDICGHSELHESTVDEAGVMRMGHVDNIVIPAGGSVDLEPGGLHVMCIDRQADLEPGDNIPFSLEFKTLGKVQVEAEIREQ